MTCSLDLGAAEVISGVVLLVGIICLLGYFLEWDADTKESQCPDDPNTICTKKVKNPTFLAGAVTLFAFSLVLMVGFSDIAKKILLGEEEFCLRKEHQRLIKEQKRLKE